MLFLMKLSVALLSSLSFLVGYKIYKTKTIRPYRFSMDTVHISDETSLYVFIACIIIALVIGGFTVYMYYIVLEYKEEIPIYHILFLLILITISIKFSMHKVIIYALIEMLLACFVVLLFRLKR